MLHNEVIVGLRVILCWHSTSVVPGSSQDSQYLHIENMQYLEVYICESNTTSKCQIAVHGAFRHIIHIHISNT